MISTCASLLRSFARRAAASELFICVRVVVKEAMGAMRKETMQGNSVLVCVVGGSGLWLAGFLLSCVQGASGCF